MALGAGAACAQQKVSEDIANTLVPKAGRNSAVDTEDGHNVELPGPNGASTPATVAVVAVQPPEAVHSFGLQDDPGVGSLVVPVAVG